MNAAGIPEIAAENIRAMLEEVYYFSDSTLPEEATPYSSDMYYAQTSIDYDHLEWAWSRFARTLKHEARFFNSDGYDLLANIFDGLDQMESHSPNVPIVRAGPGTAIEALYRARVFQSEQLLTEALIDPDLELGPPPAHLATAGRMNASGISVFYGAIGKESAVSEVRPPVGSEVMIGKFNILRPIRLLDLTALSEVSPKGSIFDPNFKTKLGNFNFLRRLGQQMAVPVLPDDQAHEFLVTQAISDFLASNFKLNLDGIIYPSVQTGQSEKNVILFHKSAKVQPIVRLPNVEVSASCRDFDYEDQIYWNNYIVTETTLLTKKTDQRSRKVPQISQRRYDMALELRKPTLEIDPLSIEVHKIRSVSYPREVHHVQRQIRHEDAKNGFSDGLPF